MPCGETWLRRVSPFLAAQAGASAGGRRFGARGQRPRAPKLGRRTGRSPAAGRVGAAHPPPPRDAPGSAAKMRMDYRSSSRRRAWAMDSPVSLAKRATSSYSYLLLSTP